MWMRILAHIFRRHWILCRFIVFEKHSNRFWHLRQIPSFGITIGKKLDCALREWVWEKIQSFSPSTSAITKVLIALKKVSASQWSSKKDKAKQCYKWVFTFWSFKAFLSFEAPRWPGRWGVTGRIECFSSCLVRWLLLFCLLCELVGAFWSSLFWCGGLVFTIEVEVICLSFPSFFLSLASFVAWTELWISSDSLFYSKAFIYKNSMRIWKTIKISDINRLSIYPFICPTHC